MDSVEIYDDGDYERDAQLQAAISALETDLGLDAGFIDALLKEDDWSFIVKEYALVEAAVTQLLITTIGKPTIADNIATMPIRAKLSMAKSLGQLDGREIACIQALAGIRNRLAHNISHVRFNLKAHVASLEEKERKQLAVEFHPYRGDDNYIDIDGRKIEAKVLYNAAFKALPKRTIHDAVVEMVALISEYKRAEAELKAYNMTVLEFAQRLTKSSAGSVIAALMTQDQNKAEP